MTRDEKPSAEYDGMCAFAVSLGKRDVAGKPGCEATHNGRRYLFSNPVAKLLWRILPRRRAAAERNWAGR